MLLLSLRVMLWWHATFFHLHAVINKWRHNAACYLCDKWLHTNCYLFLSAHPLTYMTWPLPALKLVRIFTARRGKNVPVYLGQGKKKIQYIDTESILWMIFGKKTNTGKDDCVMDNLELELIPEFIDISFLSGISGLYSLQNVKDRCIQALSEAGASEEFCEVSNHSSITPCKVIAGVSDRSITLHCFYCISSLHGQIAMICHMRTYCLASVGIFIFSAVSCCQKGNQCKWHALDQGFT